MEKIFPLNLTARAAAIVPGNPVTTRLEGGVGNCYPGLEFDHRNLDRRFFPGLVFEFVSSTQEALQGVRLIQVDLSDPDLQPATKGVPDTRGIDVKVQRSLRDALSGAEGKALRDGSWFLDTVEQAGTTIGFLGTRNQPVLDGM